MCDKHQIIEEPCEVKVSRTVLKTSGTGDSLAEFNNLATLSTGEVFPGAKKTRQLLKDLAHLQWSHRHKQLHSKNWLKAKTKIARLHSQIANIRCDYLHKLTTYLAQNHGVVVIEDLNVSGMLANGKLASVIADGSFYEFKRQLEYKCPLYGAKLIVVSRWFPSSKTCHCCGEVKESLSLEQRIFHCEKCGWTCDRDLNAALNLERVGRAAPEFTPGDCWSRLPWWKQEVMPF